MRFVEGTLSRAIRFDAFFYCSGHCAPRVSPKFQRQSSSPWNWKIRNWKGANLFPLSLPPLYRPPASYSLLSSPSPLLQAFPKMSTTKFKPLKLKNPLYIKRKLVSTTFATFALTLSRDSASYSPLIARGIFPYSSPWFRFLDCPRPDIIAGDSKDIYCMCVFSRLSIISARRLSAMPFRPRILHRPVGNPFDLPEKCFRLIWAPQARICCPFLQNRSVDFKIGTLVKTSLYWASSYA